MCTSEGSNIFDGTFATFVTDLRNQTLLFRSFLELLDDHWDVIQPQAAMILGRHIHLLIGGLCMGGVS